MNPSRTQVNSRGDIGRLSFHDHIFHILVTANNIGVNISFRIGVFFFFFFWKIHRSGIAGLYGSSIFNFSFCLFRVAPAACGASQARGWTGAASWWPKPQPQPQQCGIWVLSVTYSTAHGNTGSLTHWARAGIEHESSWILVWFPLRYDGNSSL